MTSFVGAGPIQAFSNLVNAEEIIDVLESGLSKDWVHNAAVTEDIEALRKICLSHADWWNNVAWPLIQKLKEVRHDQRTGQGKPTARR